jgi:uncharacterized protein (TIGR03437 family)
MRSLILIAGLAVCAALDAQVAVVNGASFRKEQPLAPGSWASAFGTFANVAETSAASLPLPKTLGGVTVSIDGIDAPLNYVSSGQINFLVPSGLAAGMRAIEVKTASGTISGSMWVMSAAPGIFPKDTATPPRGAIQNEDGAENSSSSPAQRGKAITIYATGPGALKEAYEDGSAAPGNPLVNTRSTPQVYIGGVEAVVQFSGYAPGFANLWQINAYVPDKTFITGKVTVQVFIDGVDSNEVTAFVAQ